MYKDIQRLISAKENELREVTIELKVLKDMLKKVHKEQTKKQIVDKPNVAIRYNIKTNSIYAQIPNESDVHICYLDTPSNVAKKCLELFPPSKYGVGAMDCDFEKWLTHKYGRDLCVAIEAEKKALKNNK